MKKIVLPIQDNELNSLLKKALENNDVRLVFDTLLKNNTIDSKKYTVLTAEKYESNDFNMKTLILGLNKNNVKIIILITPIETNVLFNIYQNIDNISMAKSYKVVDNKVTYLRDIIYDDKFNENLKMIESNELPSKLNKETVIANFSLKCLHGNWCGPKCSGPGAPIDAVDSCCKAHDLCYARKGYFSKACDAALRNCLQPYLSSSTWARIIWSAFYDTSTIPDLD